METWASMDVNENKGETKGLRRGPSLGPRNCLALFLAPVLGDLVAFEAPDIAMRRIDDLRWVLRIRVLRVAHKDHQIRQLDNSGHAGAAVARN